MSVNSSEYAEFCERLIKMIRHRWRDQQSFEDLEQEALAHFWDQQSVRPNETIAWYVEHG